MRRIVICSVLAAVIFAGSIWGVLYTCNITNSVTSDLQLVETAYQQGDTETAKQAADRAAETWDSFCKLHILVTDNEHTLEITQIIARIGSLLSQDDDELVTECDAAEKLISTYRQEQVPGILNIL